MEHLTITMHTNHEFVYDITWALAEAIAGSAITRLTWMNNDTIQYFTVDGFNEENLPNIIMHGVNETIEFPLMEDVEAKDYRKYRGVLL